MRQKLICRDMKIKYIKQLVIFIFFLFVVFFGNVVLSPFGTDVPLFVKEKYILPSCSCGPTNQLFCLREALVVSKLTGRIFVLPRMRKEGNTLNWFNLSLIFNLSFIEKYGVQAVSIDEWSKSDGAKVLTVLNYRNPRPNCFPDNLLESILNSYNIPVKYRMDNKKEYWLKWKGETEVKSYFTKFNNGTVVLQDTGRSYLRYSKLSFESISVVSLMEPSNYIKQLVQESEWFLNISWSETLGIHLRYSLDCSSICFGTEIYSEVSPEDLTFVLSNLIQKKKFKQIYLATLFPKEKFIDLVNLSLPIYVSSDIPILTGLDSQILSSVEQMISCSVEYFVGGTHSTWFEFVRDYRFGHGLETSSVEELFEAEKKVAHEHRADWVNVKGNYNLWIFYPLPLYYNQINMVL